MSVKDWLTNKEGSRAQNDSVFGNIFDFINPKNKNFMSPEDRREWDITGMTWEATGSSIGEYSDAHLSFGGASVVGEVTIGNLIRLPDGTITSEAVAVCKLDGDQKRIPATVVATPFYDAEQTRVRA